MRISSEKLSLVANVLSVIVMLQAAFILNYYLDLDLVANLAGTELQSFPQELVEEVNSQAEKEELEFEENFNSDKKAILSLTPLKIVNDEFQDVEIRLSTTELIKSVDVVIKYDPKRIEVLDLVEDIGGIQVGFGDAEVYLENIVKDGEVKLTALFEEGFSGELLVGKMSVKKMVALGAEFEFEYVGNTRQGSVVSRFDGGVNILAKPKNLSL